MIDIETLLKLRKVLIGRSISQINKSQDFIIELNHYPKRNEEYPNLVILTMLSDWYIKEVDTWKGINDSFPLDTSNLSIPYDPVRAFYLHYISENRKITDVKLDNESSLEIKFDDDFTLVLPNTNEYGDFAWIITGSNLRVSYNSEENKCYFESNGSSL